MGSVGKSQTNGNTSNSNGLINSFFSGALNVPRFMKTNYAKTVVEAWENDDITDINFSGVGNWVTQYNGIYDQGLANEARDIINYWENYKSKRRRK